jgi:predicted RNA-binding protein (virulence factor B family)
MLEYGNINKLEVIKITDIAYTLSDGVNEVFLHFNQSLRELTVGEMVDAFLYYDQKKRLCATLETPIITSTKYDFVEVVGINSAGVFVNIGIAKDILVSKDYLPKFEKQWPRIGDKIPCIIKVKTNQLVAKILEPIDLISNKLEINNQYKGIVTQVLYNGINICTSDYQMININKNLLRKQYHVGEEISFKVTAQKENIYNGTTIEQKEKARLQDSDYILDYLRKMGGMIPLGNQSTPEDIYRVLNMSKSAFKRSVGHLYKLKLITIEDDKIILIEE